MAEYIDREQIRYHRERVLNRWSGSRHTDCDVSYKDIVTSGEIGSILVADVIERSKIDKAIEEINNAEIEVDFMNDYSDGFNSGLFKALEILKRNIEE